MKSGSPGFWGGGLLIGSLKNTGEYGCIIPSKEITLYTGHYHRDLQKRRATADLSTYSRDLFRRLSEQAQTHASAEPNNKERLILYYDQAFPLNPFHRNSTSYWVKDYRNLEGDFSQTRTGATRQKFEEDEPPPCNVHKGVVTGKIYGVSRWGWNRSVCTIYLEEEKITQIEVSVPETIDTTTHGIALNTSKDGPSLTPSINYSSSTYQRIEKDTIHKRKAINTYSEEACQFAEDAAITATLVTINYSTDLLPSWNIYMRRLNAIEVMSSHKKED
ncbi:hypothetical protein PAHA111176_21740 [Parendozoicomonas haliclonae]|uniref:Uncharacterized protein n=1 Tax=Parendozoicomonas haliclonae TaxID=1960125 RepID=A0A1X7AQH7_9GAMM|nr:hypothetical protein EHSB41UT_04375 [Parendozoicomonas haliclonae]